ncbi:MAG: type II secretion system F family protein [Peptococcia bacterium]|jgi:tight adherence protein C
MFTILFLVSIVLLFLLYWHAKRKYAPLFASLPKQEFPLKESFLPMGHALLQLLHYSYTTNYDQGLYKQLLEIYGSQNARFNLQVHWANKSGYFLLGVLLVTLFSAGLGEVDFVTGVFLLALLVAVFFAPDHDLKKKNAARRLSIQLDFPDFLNKLILLINAGLTVPNAWERIVATNKKETPLYEEAARVIYEIRGGKAEYQAYEDFARRLRVPEITRFSAVVLQNMKKGSAELVPVLRLQAAECWEMRKNAAKRLGEEASTKLIFPMMLMFLAILLIVALPAVLAMQGL